MATHWATGLCSKSLTEAIPVPSCLTAPNWAFSQGGSRDTPGLMIISRSPRLHPLFWLLLNRTAGEVVLRGLLDYFYVAICPPDQAWHAAIGLRNATAGGWRPDSWGRLALPLTVVGTLEMWQEETKEKKSLLHITTCVHPWFLFYF